MISARPPVRPPVRWFGSSLDWFSFLFPFFFGLFLFVSCTDPSSPFTVHFMSFHPSLLAPTIHTIHATIISFPTPYPPAYLPLSPHPTLLSLVNKFPYLLLTTYSTSCAFLCCIPPPRRGREERKEMESGKGEKGMGGREEKAANFTTAITIFISPSRSPKSHLPKFII